MAEEEEDSGGIRLPVADSEVAPEAAFAEEDEEEEDREEDEVAEEEKVSFSLETGSQTCSPASLLCLLPPQSPPM